MEPFEAYHGRTAQQHQEAFDRLSGQGFRMIALSVYGSPSDPRYNAVWVLRPGADFLAFHGVSDADYQGRFDQAVASGQAPVLVSATGAGSSAVFAAVFERGVPGPWMARHGLDRASFEAANQQAVQGGMALRSMTVYGAAASPRFAAVWHARPAGVLTHLRALENTADYQATFDAETSLPFFRPRFVSVAEDQRIAAVFANDIVGRWVARHGLTASAYQREFDDNVAAGSFRYASTRAVSLGRAFRCDLCRARYPARSRVVSNRSPAPCAGGNRGARRSVHEAVFGSFGPTLGRAQSHRALRARLHLV